jgi:hypothetical protein
VARDQQRCADESGQWKNPRHQARPAGTHDEASAVGQGCDDQFEFEFALDVLLNSFEKLHEQGWNSTDARSSVRAG